MPPYKFDFNETDSLGEPPDDIPRDSPISPKDLAEQEAQRDTEAIFGEHQALRNRDNDRINEARLANLRKENEQMAQQLAATQETQAALIEEQAYLKGQVATIGKNNDTSSREYISEEDEAVHGHAHGYVSGVARREIDQAKAQIQQEYEAKFQDLEARFANELTLRDERVKEINGALSSNFDDDIADAAQKLGLNIRSLAVDNNFARFANRPLAVGSSKTWGDQFEENLDNHETRNTISMLQEYAKYVNPEPAVDEDALEKPVPTGSRPMTAQGRQNLERRSALLSEAEKLTDDFIAGRYAGSQEDYQKEKSALLNKADEIPTDA